MSPSGKAPDFDSGTRRFKSGHPSQQKRVRISVPFSLGWASPTDLNRSDAPRASDRLVQVERKIRLSFGTSNGS